MKTFMVQASLTIVTYDRKNMFIVQATGLKASLTLVLVSSQRFSIVYTFEHPRDFGKVSDLLEIV